jgi:hypothetical protein
MNKPETKPKIELLPAQRRAVLQRILAVSAAAMLPAIPVRAQSHGLG